MRVLLSDSQRMSSLTKARNARHCGCRGLGSGAVPGAVSFLATLVASAEEAAIATSPSATELSRFAFRALLFLLWRGFGCLLNGRGDARMLLLKHADEEAVGHNLSVGVLLPALGALVLNS